MQWTEVLKTYNTISAEGDGFLGNGFTVHRFRRTHA